MRLPIALGFACLVLCQAGVAGAQQATAEVGTIAGAVLDKSSGEVIIEAGVEVVDQKVTAKTDLDGKYALKLPPGQYQLRFSAAGYQSVRVPGIIVKVNTVTKQNVTLGSAGQAGVQVVEVVAQANRAAEATQLLQRKKDAVVSDSVSAEVMSKSTSSDAAQVVTRVPSVTVKDDRFIFIRGLGDRYSSSLLNQSRLPSTDPNRRVTPLDLFPASFLESLKITKTYSPELPGDFTAGLVDINLRDFPEQLTMSATASTGGNSQTTFQDFRGSRGSSRDWAGLGADFRKLPDAVPPPDQFPDALAKPLANGRVGRSFRDNWAIETETAPPNAGGQLSIGNTIGKFGFELAGMYSNEYEAVHGERKLLFKNDGSLEKPDIKPSSDFTLDRDTFKVKLGGVFTAAYKLSDNDKLTFRSFIDRRTDDETRHGIGIADAQAGQIREETRFRYTDQELDYGQISGEHKSVLEFMDVDWRSAFSRSFQNEPDTRHLTYVGTPGTPRTFTNDGLGGLRLFNDLNEKLTDTAVDFSIPFKTGLPFTDVWSDLPAKFKFGPAYAFRWRDTTQRFMFFELPTAGGTFDLTQPPEEVLQPSHIGPGGVTVRDVFNEVPVSQEIGGGYAMLELPLVKDMLRMTGGVRVESSFIRLRYPDQQTGEPVRVDKNNLDPLPAVNLVYSPREDMNVHFAWSKTVSRPDFRELIPLIYVEQRQDYVFVGNPNLKEAHIDNYDLRWDWFMSPLELVSVSAFHKEITDPFEQNIIQFSSFLAKSFENADKAKFTGVEVETRKDFGFVSPYLKNLSLLINGSWIDSEVTEPKKSVTAAAPVTEPKHAAVDSAPYIVNAILDYTHPDWGTARLSYNRIGSRINAVGTFGLPDITEEPRNQLDAVFLIPLKQFGYPITVKLGAENLLDDAVLYNSGDELQRTYTKGIKVVMGFTYNYN